MTGIPASWRWGQSSSISASNVQYRRSSRSAPGGGLMRISGALSDDEPVEARRTARPVFTPDPEADAAANRRAPVEDRPPVDADDQPPEDHIRLDQVCACLRDFL